MQKVIPVGGTPTRGEKYKELFRSVRTPTREERLSKDILLNGASPMQFNQGTDAHE